jgi:predicted XRE-type DNA-binding protein
MQAALFPDLYVEDELGVRDTLRERWADLNEFAERHGGLCPQRAVKDVLGISQPRVSELVKLGQLHQVTFLGVVWITGNSIANVMARQKNVGGRGRRNARLWDSVVVGGKCLVATAAAVTPDHWVE